MLYALAVRVFRLAWAVLFRWRCTGSEHLPLQGPALFCANHRAWADGITLGVVSRRRVHFMAKEELFRWRPLAWLFRELGAFPVRRGRPDRAALRHSFRLLDEGKVLGIFPEGTRNRTGQLGPGEPGAALLAARSGAPVVPAAIVGDYRIGRPLAVRVGSPFTLVPPADGRINSEWLSRQSQIIMEHIANLMAEGQEGETG
ncbi:MAG: lysophospholipid acyltransferase family protein [bacterium]|nr:lysophospholipid acyltransferase family protein [bacterium]